MKSVKEANFFERGAYRGWDNWLVVADNATLDYDEGEDLLDALDDNASKVKIKNAFIKQMSNRGTVGDGGNAIGCIWQIWEDYHTDACHGWKSRG